MIGRRLRPDGADDEAAETDDHELLIRILALSPQDAARVRRDTPPRRRPRRQVGPSADYGAD